MSRVKAGQEENKPSDHYAGPGECCDVCESENWHPVGIEHMRKIHLASPGFHQWLKDHGFKTYAEAKKAKDAIRRHHWSFGPPDVCTNCGAVHGSLENPGPHDNDDDPCPMHPRVSKSQGRPRKGSQVWVKAKVIDYYKGNPMVEVVEWITYGAGMFEVPPTNIRRYSDVPSEHRPKKTEVIE